MGGITIEVVTTYFNRLKIINLCFGEEEKEAQMLKTAEEYPAEDLPWVAVLAV